jgi:hypothetical protein
MRLASRYIAGGKIGGLVNPDILRMNNIELLAETNDSYLVLAPGDLKADADSGAFWYGIHYFYKDQIRFWALQE